MLTGHLPHCAGNSAGSLHIFGAAMFVDHAVVS